MKSVVKIRVVIFKQRKLLFKQRYQIDPILWKIGIILLAHRIRVYLPLGHTRKGTRTRLHIYGKLAPHGSLATFEIIYVDLICGLALCDPYM